MWLLQVVLWTILLMPLTLLDYRLWIAAAIVSAIAFISHWNAESPHPPPASRPSSRRSLVLLLFAPVLTLVAGLVLWKRWEDPTFVPLVPEATSMHLIEGLVAAHVLIAVSLALCFRPTRAAETAAILVSLPWAWSCAIVASMAVSGRWL
jgi:hypothetical protein